MSPNLPNGPPKAQGSPPHQTMGGVEGLINSLISPGPSTPGQGPYQPWLGINEWPQASPNGYGPIAQDHTNMLDQDAFLANGGTAYSINGAPVGQQQFPNSMAHNAQSPAFPLASSSPEGPAFAAPPSLPIKNEAAENAQRLKDLRARLLASKTLGSRESSPPSRSKNKGSATTHEHGELSNAQSAIQGSVRSSNPIPGVATPLNSKNGINADLENLFAEVRKEAKDGPSHVSNPDTSQADEPALSTAAGLPLSKGQAGEEPLDQQRPASPELSEGEIRSDEEPPQAPKDTQMPTRPGVPKEASMDSEEKSRRESEVEALYKKQNPSRDSQEKLRRQSQVDLAYSPLRKSSGGSGKLDTSAVQRKLSHYKQAPKSAVDPPSRSWVTQSKPRATEYDSYVPTYSKPSLNGLSQEKESDQGKRPAPGSLNHLRGLVDPIEGSSSGPEPQGRPQPARVISHTETVYLGQVNPDTQENRKEPQADGDDDDLKDWLELTEYYDEGYRKSRLARFRKKRELDRLRLQLDEEDKAEMQQRSLLRSSAFGQESTPQVTKMPPPSLVIRDTKHGHVGTLPDSQLATPTLKRQHAEVDTDERSKIPRVDNNRAAALALNDGASPTNAKYAPLGHRISRDDGHIGSRHRRRTRSPDRNRRRSTSPEQRRNSVPDHMQHRACHNCGEFGHYQNTCVKPRRDGRDRPRGPHQRPKFDGASANHAGKKPHANNLKESKGIVNGPVRGIDDDDKRP